MAGTIPDELLLARIRKETKAREAAFAALQDALKNATAEAQERTVAVASKLSAQIGSRTVNAQAISGIILRTQVEPGFALAEQVTTLEARVDTLDTTSQATITEIRSTMADQYEAQAQQTLTLQAVFNKNIATVTDQITVVANATSAVATRTTALEATVNNPTTGVVASYARILAEETARATADSALATRATTLEATVNNPTTGVAATAARLTTEETARANADSALASRATTLEATVFSATDGNVALKARISTEETARASADSALASRATSLEATVNDATTGVAATYARILAEETARATADSALATRATTLEATVFSATDGNVALKARISTEETARANGDTALATSISTVSATANSKAKTYYQATAPTAEAIGDIWVDTANGNALKRWNGTAWVDTTVAIGAINAAVTVESTARASADSALASRATTLEATVNDAVTGVVATAARLTTEETTRANADSALSSSISTVSATANSRIKTFYQSSTPTAVAVGDIWVDTANGNAMKRWDGSTWIDTTVAAGAISAAVTVESTARADADTALASSISTVSATASGKNRTFFQGSTPTATAIGDLWIDTTSSLNVVKRWDGSTWVDTQVASGAIGAAVASEASARATADGNLSGKYSLKVIAGNVVTGMNITSSTGSGTDVSDITFQASSFKVYNGSTGVAPFQVVGGQVRVTGSLVISSGDVSGLGSLATASSVDLSTQVTNKSLANLDGTANTKLAGIAAGADVTLTAINGGLTITSGGLTLNGTPSIKSNNYVAGSAGWAIKGDGSVEFADGTFRGTIDVGSGDTRFYKPTSGAATYGNTSAGHIAMQNYAIGTASLRLNYGANTKVDIRAQPVGTDIVGTIYVFNKDSSTFLQISGSVVSGGGAVLTWNGDTNLYRYTSGVLKTDTDLEVVGGFKFRNCPMTQRVAKSHVVTTAGGSAEETFNVDISGYGFTAKPTAGSCECASDKDYKARYDWDAAGNSSTNAVIKVSRFDGTNTGAATLRFSLIFVQ